MASLERQVRELARGADPVRDPLGQAARELQRGKTSEQLQGAARQLREGGTPQGTDIAKQQRDAARVLDRVSSLAGQASGRGSGEAQALSDRLSDTRDFRDRLKSLEDRIATLAQQAERDARSQGSEGSDAQASGKDGQRARPRPHSVGSPATSVRHRQGSRGSSQGQGDGQGRGDTMEELQQLQQEYARELQDAARMVQGSDAGGADRGGRMATPERQEFSRSAPGTEAFKQDFARWDSLRKGIANAMDRYEAGSRSVWPSARRPSASRHLARQGAGPLHRVRRPVLPVVESPAGVSLTLDIRFAYAPPAWAWALGGVAIFLLALAVYRSARATVSAPRWALLVALRVITLAVVALILLRPVMLVPAPAATGRAVAIVVDDSRSMQLPDKQGIETRLQRARQLVAGRLRPMLQGDFDLRVFAISDTLREVPSEDALTGNGRGSDLGGAVTAMTERAAAGEFVGMVLVSDGAASTPVPSSPGSLPVFAIGVGASGGVVDREVRDVAVSDVSVVDSFAEVTANLVSHGARDTVDVRLLENGRPLVVRPVRLPGNSQPVRERFRVSPSRTAATVYTVEVTEASGELTPANNRARSSCRRRACRTRSSSSRARRASSTVSSRARSRTTPASTSTSSSARDAAIAASRRSTCRARRRGPLHS